MYIDIWLNGRFTVISCCSVRHNKKISEAGDVIGTNSISQQACESNWARGTRGRDVLCMNDDHLSSNIRLLC